MKVRSIPSATWHGQQLTTMEISGCRLTELSYAPDYAISRHAHELPLFYFVKRGSFTQTYGRKVRDCKPATLLYLRADETHADKFHRAGADLFVIELLTEWFTRNSHIQNLLRDSWTYQGGFALWVAQRVHHEYRNMDDLSPLAIEGFILELIVETSRLSSHKAETSRERWLIRAEELLRARLSDRLSINEIARTVEVDPVHLARTCRQHHNCSIGEYVRRLRVDSAHRQAKLNLPDKTEDRLLAEHPAYVRRFAIRTGRRIALVLADEIDWIEAAGDYATLHVGKRSVLLRETFNSLEKRLDPEKFIRIHRSTIVEASRIHDLRTMPNRELRLRLIDGTELKVSRTYREHFDRWLERESPPAALFRRAGP